MLRRPITAICLLLFFAASCGSSGQSEVGGETQEQGETQDPGATSTSVDIDAELERISALGIEGIAPCEVEREPVTADGTNGRVLVTVTNVLEVQMDYMVEFRVEVDGSRTRLALEFVDRVEPGETVTEKVVILGEMSGNLFPNSADVSCSFVEMSAKPSFL